MGEKHALAEVLRAEIMKIAGNGDVKNEGELTPEVLMRIVRVAKTGHELLVALSASPANLASMIKRPNSSLFEPYSGNDSMSDSGQQMSFPIATSSMPENFGMTAIREVIAAAKNMNGNGTSPVKLVEALVVARDNGLHDVARELEAQLGIGKPKDIQVERSEEKENKP